MIGRILVPLDGSELAEGVLPYVMEIARRSQAEVLLLTSIQPVGVWDAAATAINWAREETLAQGYLDSKREQLRGNGLQVRDLLVHGEAAGAVLKAAEQEHVDLIAISTHGRSGISRWLLGGVADRVLHDTGVPLLVIRPPKSKEQTPSPVFRKMLVPLDGSPVAESVLPFAEDLARLFGASLVLFHAVAPVVAYPGFETVQPRYTGELLEEMQKQAQQFLSRVAKQVQGRGLEVSMVVSIDLAVDGIISAAKEVGADLIALGTHGRSGLGRMVMGSVADAVVRRTTLPCLLINPAKVARK